MKRILFVTAAIAVLAFAFASPAFAGGINHSGQDRTGAAAAAPSEVTQQDGTVETVDGAGTNTYMDWNTVRDLGDNPPANSPHGNYTTTTIKCVVCHAVHYAAPGGAPVSSGTQAADTLLRVKAAEACGYCHATTGQAVNGRPVYNGNIPADYRDTGGDSNIGHFTGPNCSECHTGVHGAGADNSVASLSGYLLRSMTTTNTQGLGNTDNMIEAITNIDHKAESQGFGSGFALNGTIGDYAGTSNPTLREQAVGIFCAECHRGSYLNAMAGVTANVFGSDVAANAVSGHRIAASATNNWNSDGSKSSTLTSGTIAWAAATNCKSCHDAEDDYTNPAFPHAWGSTLDPTKMWLTMAPNFETAKTSVGAPAANAYNDTRVQLSDGVCLKCHRSGTALGVGLTW